MLNIIKPRQSDLEQIKTILCQWTEPAEVEKYLLRFTNEINGQTEYGMQFWIAEDNGVVMGVVGLSDPMPNLLTFAQTKNPGEIKILYVDGQSQGKGIGKELINFIQMEAAKKRYSELLVRSAQKYKLTAYGFYEKLGYTNLGAVGSESKQMQVFGKVIAG